MHASRLYLGYRERFVDDCVVSLPKRRRLGSDEARGTAVVRVSQAARLPKGGGGAQLDDEHEVAQGGGADRD